MIRTKDIFYFYLLPDVTSCLQITENAPPFQFVESGAPLTAMILPEHHPVITGNKTQQAITSRQKHLCVPTARQYTFFNRLLFVCISRSWPLVFFSSKSQQKIVVVRDDVLLISYLFKFFLLCSYNSVTELALQNVIHIRQHNFLIPNIVYLSDLKAQLIKIPTQETSDANMM